MKIIDISYNSKISTNGLERRLSNLYPYEFTIDGYVMTSWEGFIQSLKTPDIRIKEKLWGLYGYQAWKQGQNINWWDKQEVYWVDKPIDRHSDEYTDLITYSYNCLFEQNEKFRDALKDSIVYKLDHSKGKTNKSETLLTKGEYLEQMNRLRDKLKPNRFFNLFG
ncbi:MAG: hypothetical protein ACOC3Z_03520 [Nanoarchaeota archaeon]